MQVVMTVEFIGSGEEVVKQIKVDASSYAEAFRKAEEWYKTTEQKFYYYCMEIKDADYLDF